MPTPSQAGPSVSSASNTEPLQTSSGSNGRAQGKGASHLPVIPGIIRKIVRKAQLEVHALHVHSPSSDGVKASVSGALKKTGPFAARVSFPFGVEVLWAPPAPAAKYVTLGTVELPPVRIRGGWRGAVLDLPMTLGANQNEGALAMLARAVVSQQGIKMRVRTDRAQVRAYGLRFGAVPFEKDFSLVTLGGLGGTLRFDGEDLARRTSETKGERTTPESSLEIEQLEILAGSEKEGIHISAAVRLPNNSMLKAQLGSLSLALGLAPGQGSMEGFINLGTLSVPNFELNPGANVLRAEGSIRLPPAPPAGIADKDATLAHEAGQRLLTALLQNEALPITVLALRSLPASPASWLAEALTGARISAIMPGLGPRAQLLQSAELRMDGTKAEAEATLMNGFGADLQVLQLEVRVVTEQAGLTRNWSPAHALDLGRISTTSADSSATWNLRIPAGQSVRTALPFELNSDPTVLVALFKSSAAQQGVDLGAALNQVLETLPTSGSETPTPGNNTLAEGKEAQVDSGGMDLPSLLVRALARLTVTAHVQARASLGHYALPGLLSFTQTGLSISVTPDTARALIPEVGAPIVKSLLDSAQIKLSALEVRAIELEGVKARAKIVISDFGPIGAEITFGEPLEVRMDGEVVARITMGNSLTVGFGQKEEVLER